MIQSGGSSVAAMTVAKDTFEYFVIPSKTITVRRSVQTGNFSIAAH